MMEKKLRTSGINAIGDFPWGTHVCQFYQTKEDLIDILVPYFKTGLKNNELCMWVTAKPLESEDARRSLKKAVRNLDDYIKKGQIEILDANKWYTKKGKFDSDRVMQGWIKKEKAALKKGFDGLRISGNTFWLDKRDWRKFAEHEKTVNSIIDRHRIVSICSYSLEKCGVPEIMDVVSNHPYSLIKRHGKFEYIEMNESKRMWDAPQNARDGLDQTLRKRTAELIDSKDQSQREIIVYKQEQKTLKLNESRLEALLKLSEMESASTREIADFVLEEGVLLTKSKIGFLGFMNDDNRVMNLHAWSKSVMEECAVTDKPLQYDIEKAGIWGESVRKRKMVIINNYSAPNPHKKGYPKGHVKLVRLLMVPILDRGRVVALMTVGNKMEEYDKIDIRQLRLLMDGMWKLVERKRVDAELSNYREHLEKLVSERTYDLGERVKELNCLFNISKLVENPNLSFEEMLQGVVDLLPSSWQYQEITRARVIVDRKKFESANFRASEWKQTADIKIKNKIIGAVEVYYLKKKPILDEGPFLKEERLLIDAVSERISRITERIRADQQLKTEQGSLKNMNIALREVLAKVQDEKEEIGKTTQANVDKIVMPILHALENEVSSEQQKYVSLLKGNLEDITSPFTSTLSKSFMSLTPVEIQICNMIKNGLSTKEIARLRHVSPATVNRHRENIRRKLGMTKKNINMTTYLNNFMPE